MLNINLRIGEKLGFLLGLVSPCVGFQELLRNKNTY